VGIQLNWEGKGLSERGIIADIKPSVMLKKYDRRDQMRELHQGQVVVAVDPRYFRATEVDTLLGDPSKAQKKLGWKREISFKQMVKEMIEHDLKDGMREAIWKKKGFEIPESFEANM
jgi:GDPmannose 4,6-dehydratase